MTRADLRARAAELELRARELLALAYSYPRGPMRDETMHRCWAVAARAAEAMATARSDHDAAEKAAAKARQHETWAAQMEGARQWNLAARGEVPAVVRP
jgi:hypothetical protein